jgi:phosphoribosyl-ATP pyrophosphohydrolase
MLNDLFEIVKDRKLNPRPGSYTNQLLTAGSAQITRKVGEEAIEVIIAAGSEGKQRVVEETADLLYHLWVLLVAEEIELEEIEAELADRHKETR